MTSLLSKSMTISWKDIQCGSSATSSGSNYALEMFVLKEKEKLEYLVKIPTLRERIELTMNSKLL